MGSGYVAEIFEPVVYGVARGKGLMQMAVAIDLKSRFSFEQLSKAVLGLVRSYPILGCFYSPGFWRDHWVPCPGFSVEQAVVVEDDVADVEDRENYHVSSFIDPEKGWPIRVVVLNHSRGSRLLIIFPHILGDGNAGLTIAQGLGAWLCGPGLPENIKVNRGIFQLAQALGFKSLLLVPGELLREAGKFFYIPFMGRWDQGFVRVEKLTGRMNYHKVVIKGLAFQNFSASLKKNKATINDGLAAIMAWIVNRRSKSSWTGTAYTVNLRRYLKDPGPIIANLSGVNTLALMIKPGTGLAQLFGVVALRTQEHKGRLPGIAFNLLPMIFFGWLPHRPMHWFGRSIIGRLILWQSKRMGVFTNIGSMDQYMTPYGSEVEDAYMLGVFEREMRVPVVMATGFRDRLCVSVCAADDISEESVAGLAKDWQSAVDEFSGGPDNHL